MKHTARFAAVAVFLVFVSLTSLKSQTVAIFSYPVEIELTNDQGDLPVKDYLKNYGTKGKKQGVEYMYGVATPFLFKHLEELGYQALKADTLASVKANEYGMPSLTLSKAVETGIAGIYLKVYLKDITQPPVEGLTQQDINAQSRKIVKMRCRLQFYGPDKKILQDVTGEFQSGEKIDNPTELGVDLRRYQGSDFLQELKIYETCTKMSIHRALQNLSK